ncbi:MAG: AI-2E family transporter [Methylococcales bacterium]
MNQFLANKPILSVIPGVLLAGLLVLSFMVLKAFIFTLVWAFIIAYVSWPPYQWLCKRCQANANLSAAIMTGLIAVLLLMTIYWLADMLQDELKLAYQAVVDNVAEQTLVLPEFIKRIPWLGQYVQDWLTRSMADQTQLKLQALGLVKQWSGEFGKFLGGLGGYVVKLGVILVTVFFCFRDGDAAIKQLKQGLTRFLGGYQHVYLQAVGNTTRAVVYGIVLAALAQGSLAGIGYAVAGVQAPVLFGAMTALLALVPMGATLVWLPISAGLLLTGQVWPGIGLLLWGVLVVSTVDNVIRPIVISGASRVPFPVVLFGVLGGLTAFGLVGLFLGPVILSVLLTVWQAWLQQQTALPADPGADEDAASDRAIKNS